MENFIALENGLVLGLHCHVPLLEGLAAGLPLAEPVDRVVREGRSRFYRHAFVAGAELTIVLQMLRVVMLCLSEGFSDG